ncbi:MAG: hypothetical protein WC073_05425 [Sterolibacterium sp.]
MKLRASMLALVAAGSLVATPVCADRGGGHGHGSDHFWGPFGFLLGTAILYSAVQPRTVYVEPRVVYAPPVYAPAIVQPYYVEQAYANPPVVSLPPPPPNVAQILPPEVASGQWWYFCKKPAGYYPYVKECPNGWEKVSPTPPGTIKP